MLKVSGLNQFYGQSHILRDVQFDVAKGSCACLMGRNGVGKTTLLKCLMGLLPVRTGEIVLNGASLVPMRAEARAGLGVAYVPQGREIFPMLTVEENLRTGLRARRDGSREIPERVFDIFPVLKTMLQRRGGDLSGGQQQQLAIGRALVIDPELLILDEPTEGIQPNVVHEIGEVILRLNRELAMTVFMVEPKLPFARRVAERFLVMDKGSIVTGGDMEALNEERVQRYLTV